MTPLYRASVINVRSLLFTFCWVIPSGPASVSEAGLALPGPPLIDAKFVVDGGGIVDEVRGVIEVRALYSRWRVKIWPYSVVPSAYHLLALSNNLTMSISASRTDRYSPRSDRWRTAARDILPLKDR